MNFCKAHGNAILFSTGNFRKSKPEFLVKWKASLPIVMLYILVFSMINFDQFTEKKTLVSNSDIDSEKSVGKNAKMNTTQVTSRERAMVICPANAPLPRRAHSHLACLLVLRSSPWVFEEKGDCSQSYCDRE